MKNTRAQTFLDNWLRGTHCRTQTKLTIEATSFCGKFALFKHAGHDHRADWTIKGRCETYYVAFDVRQEPPKAGQLCSQNPELWRKTGRLRNVDKADLVSLLQTAFLFADGTTVRPVRKALPVKRPTTAPTPPPKYAFVFEGRGPASGSVLVVAASKRPAAARLAMAELQTSGVAGELLLVDRVRLVSNGLIYGNDGG